MYYELHITIGLHPVSARPLIEALHNWKFSHINGDPILGNGAYEYATRHASSSTDFEEVVTSIQSMACLLKTQGYPVIRQKIELVLYDKMESK